MVYKDEMLKDSLFALFHLLMSDKKEKPLTLYPSKEHWEQAVNTYKKLHKWYYEDEGSSLK